MEILDFIDALASADPAPGGGGGSAYAGAMGLSLSQMALNITLKSAKKEEDKQTLALVIQELEALRQEMYQMIQADAKAFLPLSQAYKLSKTDPERDAKIQAGLVSAVQVPMETLRMNYKGIRLHQQAKSLSSKMLISDVGTGATISLSSLKGAYMNVLVNTRSIKDVESRQAIESEAEYLLKSGARMAEEVYSDILELMR